jgi:hypothetical protein
MKCPSCNEEANIIVQDPDFESLELKGTQAIITIIESQFCDKCSTEIQTDRFRAVVEVSEAVAHPDGEAHTKDLHPDGLEGEEGEFDVKFRFVCSCGASFPHIGKAVPLDESTEPAPWG